MRLFIIALLFAISYAQTDLHPCEESFRPKGEENGTASYTIDQLTNYYVALGASSQVNTVAYHAMVGKGITGNDFSLWHRGNLKLCNEVEDFSFCTTGYSAGLCLPSACAHSEYFYDGTVRDASSYFSQQNDYDLQCFADTLCEEAQVQLIMYARSIAEFTALGTYPEEAFRIFCEADADRPHLYSFTSILTILLIALFCTMPLVYCLMFRFCHGDPFDSGDGRLITFDERKRILSAFDAYQNQKQAFDYPKDRIHMLDGLRTLSMLTIASENTYNIWSSLAKNYGTMNADWLFLTNGSSYMFKSSFPAMFFASSLFSKVGAFSVIFFISGFVLFYSIDRRRPRINQQGFLVYFSQAIALRYFRLTILFIFLVLFWWRIVPYLTYEINYWDIDRHAQCDKFWKIAFYLNNEIFGISSINCFPHAWLLACDFQLFIIALITGKLYVYNRQFSIIAISTLLLLASIWQIVKLQNNDLSPFSDDEQYKEFDSDMAHLPMYRAVPYFTGCLVAVLHRFLVEINYKTLQSKLYVNCSMVAFLFTMWIILYFAWKDANCDADVADTHQCGSGYSRLSRALLIYFTPLVFCASVAIWILSTLHGVPCFISGFISQPLLATLGPLCIFAFYLIHEPVIYLIQASVLFKWNLSWFTFLMLLSSVVVMSFLVTFVVYILIEMPVKNLVTYLEELTKPEDLPTSKMLHLGASPQRSASEYSIEDLRTSYGAVGAKHLRLSAGRNASSSLGRDSLWMLPTSNPARVMARPSGLQRVEQLEGPI